MRTYEDPGEIAVSGYVLDSPADGDRIAVVDHSRGAPREWTYGDLTRAISGLAGCLRSLRLGEDAVVAVLTENSAEFVIAYHGTLTAGCTVLPLDPRDPARWAAAIAETGAEALIVETALGIPESSIPATHTIVIGDGPPGCVAWAEALRAAPDPQPVRGGERPAVLMSSSGTLRGPKRIAVTHHNLVANLAQIAALHEIRSGDVVLSVPPLRHIYGMQMAMNPVLRAGATLVIVATPFSVPHFLGLLRDHQVAVAYVVPSVLAELAAMPSMQRAWPDLRLAVSGGAPLPTSVAVRSAESLGVPVVQGFGMTEAGCVCFSPDGRAVPIGSVGVPLPGTEVRFVDPETGTDVAPGRPGELWVRGPQVVPAGADPSMPRAEGGWLRTGDLAAQDDEGFVRITGRIKSLIKYKGYQVSPAELEDVLATHPAVAEALVAGLPDPVAGEVPKAYVVLNDRVPLSEITRHVADRVAPYKRVRAIERVQAIPRSSTGKPTRPPALRALVTGGGRGLGRAFAEGLAAAGASVLVTGRDEAGLLETAKGIRERGGIGEYAVADLTDPQAWARVLGHLDDTLGGVDVLVNNAGAPGPIGPLWEVDEDAWWHAMEVNVRGSALVTRAILPRLLDQGGGRVVTVVSRAGRKRWPHAGAYSISKAALISLTANLDGEVHGTGITAVAFDPGLLDIGITRAHLDRGHTGDRWADEILDWTLAARDAGRFTPVETAVRALVAVATGAADHLAGRYVTIEDLSLD
ncbi:SDR family NAD(P)-dependent oxidoreductase [Actinoallomurus spadix]|uniref:SDR family NAD(P)-dependent oxidoreductase n=1 Tax=Actinoallomurus spadix TaxID=79912 RepID=UPI002092B780|nr:SDR family NAD(P)-dependent oxidoreductase [Actinoallomurus spadix]MCO5988885.1 SDR family NAD(P)-dependent oxidoreductase [Actinoallomurus spadix]